MDKQEQFVSHQKKLNKHWQNYSVIYKEALEMYWTASKFYECLTGNKIVLVTDHKLLLALFREKKEFHR